ncbi:ring canal kelch protein [Paramyrothecium foliicola]|nr:ring canal kelch protein [Paramyrothecium foliicola]
MRTLLQFMVVSAVVSPTMAVDVCKGTWTTLAPIPIIPRQENSAVAINSTTIAVLGGLKAVDSTWNNTGLLTYYDIPSDTWTEGPGLPIGLNHPNAAAHNGKIYLLGGLAETESGPWTAVPDVWALDPSSGKWDSLTPFPEGSERGASVVGVYEDKIFIAGGLRSLDFVPGGAHVAVDTVSAYDTASNDWISYPKAALPVPKDHAAGGVVGSSFWITGGRHLAAGDIVTNDVFVLDLKNVEAGWSDLTETAPIPTPRGGHIAGVVGELIYTFGGEGPGPKNGVFNQTEVLDTRSREWKTLDPMPLPRHGTVGVAIGKSIYIPGGGLALGTMPTNTTEVFRP